MYALCLYNLMHANTRESLVEFESPNVIWKSFHKLSNSPKLSLVLSGYINTGGHFLFLKYIIIIKTNTPIISLYRKCENIIDRTNNDGDLKTFNHNSLHIIRRRALKDQVW